MDPCFVPAACQLTATKRTSFLAAAVSPRLPGQLRFRTHRSSRIAMTAPTEVGATPSEGIRTSEHSSAGGMDDAFGFSDLTSAGAVDGEWFGYESSFSVRDGAPRNIPERYVPDDFRDWGVEVKGFECLTSSKCTDGSLLMKRTRALPSVGCEADAVVPEVAEQTFSSAQENAINGAFPDGTVSCGPAEITDEHSQRWNVSLVDPREGVRSRVRVEFGLVNEPFGAVTMFLEHWDAEFCNGEILPGCGANSQSFATDAPLDTKSALPGQWEVQSTTYVPTADGWKLTTSTSSLDRNIDSVDAEVNVALPQGVSVGIAPLTDGSKCVCAGWVVDDGIRIVSRRTYSATGALTSVSRDVERMRS